MRPTSKRSRLVECVRRRPGLVLLLLPAALLASLYVASSEVDYEFESRYPSLYKSYNVAEGEFLESAHQSRVQGYFTHSLPMSGTVEGYLVWNPRCQMLSKEPLDPSIRFYVKRERFESCSSEARFTRLSRDENGSAVLLLDPEATARHPGLECCWSAVLRSEKQPAAEKANKDGSFDSSIV